VLGLQLLAVRLPSALAGIVAVGLIFLIGQELLSSEVGVIAAALYAIEPWTLQFSRGGWEVNLANTLVLAGIWLALRSRKQMILILPSVLFFGLSMYTYHAARLFSPLIGMLLGLWFLVTWVRQIKLKKKKPQHSVWRRFALVLVLTTVLLGLFLYPLLSQLKNPAVSSRFSDTSIFNDPTPVLTSNALIAAHGNTRLARVVYHRYWFYGQEILAGWVKHYTVAFLFERGDGNLRHGVKVMGLLYPEEAVFLGVTAVYIVWQLKRVLQKKKPVFLAALGFLVLWIILAGVPPALVTPTPHALRFLLASGGFVLLAAFGVWTLLQWLPKCRSLLLLLIVLTYGYSLTHYLSYYYTLYPVRAAADWQYGYQELYAKLDQLKRPEEKVVVSTFMGRPSMYYLFYHRFDPATIQRLGPSLPKDQLELLAVGDYSFEGKITPVRGTLFATAPDQVAKNATVLSTVKNLDGTVVWIIWRSQ
jgi:hypothetical protein